MKQQQLHGGSAMNDQKGLRKNQPVSLRQAKRRSDEMSEKIDVSVTIEASKDAAWALLADYGNPHKYVGGIVDAYLTTEQTSGVGMTRHCTLPRMMMMKQYIVEEISAWDEGKSFAYIVTDTTAPITDGILEWSVDGDDRRSVIKVRRSFAYSSDSNCSPGTWTNSGSP